MDGDLIFFLCFITVITLLVSLFVAFKLPSFDGEPTPPHVQRATFFTVMSIVFCLDLVVVVVSLT